MAIRVVCQACEKRVSVPDEIAGRRARCQCGATFRVPRLKPDRSMTLGQRRRLLAEATLDEVLAELRRRGCHGVFAQVDLDEFGVESLSDLVDGGEPLNRGIDCYATEPLDDDRHDQLLSRLADGVQRVADPGLAVQADSYYEPFSFKGDPLGMPLDEFKQRRHRVLPGQTHPAPFCSDRLGGGFAIADLHTEPWHAQAGIVHARLDFPSEERSPPFAGVPTDLVLYQFLDGKLFRVTVLFGHEGVPQVASSLRGKYGPPTDEPTSGSPLMWRRLHSSVVLTKGRISPRQHATVVFAVDESVAEAESRRREHLESF